MIIVSPNMQLETDYNSGKCVWNEGGERCQQHYTTIPKWISPDGRIVSLTWGSTGLNLRFCDEHLAAFLLLQKEGER